MNKLLYYWNIYWEGVLGKPLDWASRLLDTELQTGWRSTGIKLLLTLAILFFVYSVYLSFKDWLRRRRLRSVTEAAVHAARNGSPDTAADMVSLRKQKRWPALAEAFTERGMHADAAWAWRKAGDRRKAAKSLVQSGGLPAAARLYCRVGDYEAAADCYRNSKRYRSAIRALKKAGNLSGAAFCYAVWGKFLSSAETYLQYFKTTQDSPEDRVTAALQCIEAFEQKKAWNRVSDDKRIPLQCELASCLDNSPHQQTAAKLFLACGEHGRAGDIFLRLGQLEESFRCLKQAGREREANAVGGRFYESKGLWKEAGMAYEGGNVFLRAGDCFSKANAPVDAARCYEKGGEYFGAGFALVHARAWEPAIKMLQQVPESALRYDESRALLGRCFYEMKDHAHCVAALENHLTGTKVTSANVDYFWMLALAYEQTGDLEKSLRTLQRIRAVNLNYRDVAQRLSNIESRISMVGEGIIHNSTAPWTAPPASGQATEVVQMVEKSTGNRYAIERELGRGGMGVVYLARDTQLDRPVALKFLGAMVDHSEEFRQRFVREAKAAAKVSHPNIVAIYDIGSQEGSAYIAMEYVEGTSLTRYLAEKGCLSVREAVNIALQVCSALHAIHEQGIVHRDIKPDNILIGRGGLIKVMDFGLAKIQDMRLTAPGMVMGTPCYMPPEQIRGAETDARSDIYALGLVFYELFTGKMAFGEGNVVNSQLYDMPVPPRDIVPYLPESLETLILRCIAKNPEERFASCQELSVALRQTK